MDKRNEQYLDDQVVFSEDDLPPPVLPQIRNEGST